MNSLFTTLLPRAKTWALILGIFWAIYSVFGLLAVIVNAGASRYTDIASMLSIFIGAAISIAFTVFLLRYQSACGRAVLTQRDSDLVQAARQQKNYIILNGVLCLLILLILLISFAGALIK